MNQALVKSGGKNQQNVCEISAKIITSKLKEKVTNTGGHREVEK